MIESLVLATVFLASSQPPAGRSDCRPSVLERSSPTRSETENYYDQGRASIAVIYPRHRLLAERRAGQFGAVQYALLAYQPESSAVVSIRALAVDWQARRAWSIESACAVDVWAGGLISTLVALGGLPGRTPVSADAALVEAVRSTVVREIDPRLSSVSFDGWLTGLVGTQVRTQWEVNDCGEQTGNPALDRGRDFPKCVQLRVGLTGNRLLMLLLSVGSQQKQPAGAPAYHHGVLIQPNGSRVEVRRLTDLASVIKAM
jgi:hypothetical protein